MREQLYKRIIIFQIVAVFLLQQFGWAEFERETLAPVTAFRGSVKAEDKDTKKILEQYYDEIERVALREGWTIDAKDEEILKASIRNNAWAISRGVLDVQYVARGYFGGPNEAKILLREKVSGGIASWSEMLYLVELHPSIFERIYVDLDNTLFKPQCYLGSKEWHSNEKELHDNNRLVINSKEYQVNKALLENNLFVATEPDIRERLKKLKADNPGLQIIGFTSRKEEMKEITKEILSKIGIDIPVEYLGTTYKIKKLKEELRKRDNYVEQKNNRIIQETIQRLKKDGVKLPSDPEEREQVILENADLEYRGIWLFMDDMMDRICRDVQGAQLANERVYTLHYLCDREHKWRHIAEKFDETLSSGDMQAAIIHAIDVLALQKLDNNAEDRKDFYFHIEKFVKHIRNDRLTTAYIESISDLLSSKMEEDSYLAEILSENDRRKILTILFELTMPYSVAEAWVEAFERGEVGVKKIEMTSGITPDAGNYQLILDENNAYLFLEPLLRYLKEKNPDVIVLPDTGARPFKPLLEYFIDKEGLRSQIVIFPVSYQAASDTEYEMQRWRRLLNEEIETRSQEDEKLVETLKRYNFEALDNAKTAVMLDDNIARGETAIKLRQILKDEWDIDQYEALTPYACSSPHEYKYFPVLSTFRSYGSFNWKTLDKEVAPPLVVRTVWEYDFGKLRGAKSRPRYIYPSSLDIKSEEGDVFRRDLLENFKKDYSSDTWEKEGTPVAVRPQDQGSFPSILPEDIELNDSKGILPDLIKVNNDLRLTRRKEKVPFWVRKQYGLTHDDCKRLGSKDVFFYEIENATGEILGFVAMALVTDAKGDKGIVIRKLQPEISSEKLFEPKELVEGIRRYVAEAKDDFGIKGLYILADRDTMMGLSQSHWLRRTINRGYKYLPFEQENLYLSGSIDDWLGRLSIVWKKLSEEQKDDLNRARKELEGIYALVEEISAEHEKLIESKKTSQEVKSSVR
ncbi:DUF2608 domain-containing protein, partial [Candidatus Auribacterota bacterium]